MIMIFIQFAILTSR